MMQGGKATNGLLSAPQQRLARDWKLYLEQRQLGARFREDLVQERINYETMPSVKVWLSAREVPKARRNPSATLMWSDDMELPSTKKKVKASRCSSRVALTTAEMATKAQLASLAACDRAVVNQLAVEHSWLHATHPKGSTTGLELPISDEKLVGASNAACENLPSVPFWKQGQTESELRPTVGAGGQAFDAKAELLRERERFTLEDAMAYLRDDEQDAYSVAFVGVGVAIGAIGTFKTKLFKPKWSAEIHGKLPRGLWVHVT